MYAIQIHGQPWPPGNTCVASPTKRKKCRFWGQNLRLEASLPPFFSCTTFRSSVKTPALPLIRKSTILSSPLSCSHYNMANRHQFSCPLGIATLALKLEHMVPGRWIFFLVLWPSTFFSAPRSMSSTRTYEYFSKHIIRCRVRSEKKVGRNKSQRFRGSLS